MLFKKLADNLIFNKSLSLQITVRYGHHLRGKPPGIARSIKDRLQELKGPERFRVDIGLPKPQSSRSKQLKERLETLKQQRKDPNLEKLARSERLLVNLEEVNKIWLKTNGFYTIKEVAEHYGIFDHLYGDAYFYPVVPLTVGYANKDIENPVYFGNIIKPEEALIEPKVNYESDANTFWTLILTNPDGHFTETNKEYVHWFIANIPANNVEKGEVIWKYLQPFPLKGTGFHRFIFVLYKQDKKLDFAKYKPETQQLDLSKRTFSTLDFYRENQDNLTPAGLAFFQTDWDKSVHNFYHNALNMKEPIYEYDMDPPYIRKPEWFPLRKPFNLYMDKYRDPKQINKEFLERKLKKVHPFKKPPPPLPYPNAIRLDHGIPSWLKLEMRKSRNKWGRINDIE